LTLISTKSFVGWRFAPDATGDITALPETLKLYSGGLLLKGGEGEERKKRGREGESSSFALGRKRKVDAYATKA